MKGYVFLPFLLPWCKRTPEGSGCAKKIFADFSLFLWCLWGRFA